MSCACVFQITSNVLNKCGKPESLQHDLVARKWQLSAELKSLRLTASNPVFVIELPRPDNVMVGSWITY